MADDMINISYDKLNELAAWLEEIVGEFDAALANADVLESAIKTPYGERALRDAADEFERQWNDRRVVLRDDLKAIQEHVQGVVDGFKDGDRRLSH